MFAKLFVIKAIMDNECSHAGAAIRARDCYAIDIGLRNAREGSDHFGYLGGRHIFSLPTEGVADAIDEIEIAAIIFPHQVTGAVPGIALLEYIAKNFFRRFLFASVTFETPARG